MVEHERTRRHSQQAYKAADDVSLAKFAAENGLDPLLVEELMREVVTKDPGIRWSNIAGNEGRL